MTVSSFYFVVSCCCIIVLLSEIRPFGYAMDCDDPEDEGVCHRYCQSRGSSYGRCEYSECNCYGRRRIWNSDSRYPPLSLTQQRPALQSSVTTTQRPVAIQKRALVCSSNLKSSDKTSLSNYQSCRSWCEESQFEMYMSLDNLCCCRKKE